MSHKPQHFELSESELRVRGVLPETFEAAYSGSPAWEIGRPQPFVEALLARNALHGRVLDIGCGTCENALLMARHGLDIVAIDIVDAALATARQKIAAAEQKKSISLWKTSVFDLNERLGTFDCALDSGTFHVFSDADQIRYAAAVRARLCEGGLLYLATFSEREQRPGGPRRLTEGEIRDAFASGWIVRDMEEITYAATRFEGGAKARLTTLQRNHE
ncbi:MAG: class I SAM-dependent methyltransferase [Phycisphaerae bacterium]